MCIKLINSSNCNTNDRQHIRQLHNRNWIILLLVILKVGSNALCTIIYHSYSRKKFTILFLRIHWIHLNIMRKFQSRLKQSWWMFPSIVWNPPLLSLILALRSFFIHILVVPTFSFCFNTPLDAMKLLAKWWHTKFYKHTHVINYNVTG